MKTLDDALALLLRVNALVEQFALSVKNNRPTGTFMSGIRRQLPALAEKLKNQFGMIADQAVQLNLVSSRGASEQVRVRSLREGVAHLKTALEIAITHVIDKHELTDGKESEKAEE